MDAGDPGTVELCFAAISPANRDISGARSAGLEPATFSVRSQDTCVCSCIWMLKNRISKPTSYSGCSQLFTWVTVKSLSTTLASNDQPAAFRCGEGRSSRKLISGTEIHWKPSFREEPLSEVRWVNTVNAHLTVGARLLVIEVLPGWCVAFSARS